MFRFQILKTCPTFGRSLRFSHVVIYPVSPSILCGHHLSPRIVIVVSLLSRVPNFSLSRSSISSSPLLTHPVTLLLVTFHMERSQVRARMARRSCVDVQATGDALYALTRYNPAGTQIDGFLREGGGVRSSLARALLKLGFITMPLKVIVLPTSLVTVTAGRLKPNERSP